MKTPIQEVLETYEVMLSLHSEMAVSVRSVVEDLKSHLEKEKEFMQKIYANAKATGEMDEAVRTFNN